ncbi:MAG: hypothetical protein AAFY08_14425 [Planctomycetota bacterium]
MTTAAPLAPSTQRPTSGGLRLAPFEDVDTVELAGLTPTAVAPDGVGASCPDCGSRVAEGSIAQGEISYERVGVSNAARVPTVLRQFYCAHCRGIVTWVEALDRVTGRPSGHAVIGPGLIKDRRKIDAFLKRHPHCTTGVTDPGRP